MLKKNNRALRRRLFAADPRCHWCNRLTRLVDGPKLPDDAATVDHVYGRLDPRRRLTTTAATEVVLACYRCNHRRCHEDNIAANHIRRERRRLLDGGVWQ